MGSALGAGLPEPSITAPPEPLRLPADLQPQGRQVLGGSGLHPRVGPEGLEIGYWLDAAHTGRGLATEAARALTRAAFELPWVRRVEIHCDPANLASAAIPRRLGYRLVEHRKTDTVDPFGQPRDTWVWRVERGEVGELGRDCDQRERGIAL